MNTKWIKNLGYIVIVLLVLGGLAIKNFGNENFWEANLIQILTLLLTSILSFYLVQHLTDKRRKVDCIDHILCEIQCSLETDETIYSDCKEALRKQGTIANRIKLLKEYSFSQIQSEIEYISKEFEETRDLYSNHFQKAEGLEPIIDDINRHKDNIMLKCDKIRIMLYNL